MNEYEDDPPKLMPGVDEVIDQEVERTLAERDRERRKVLDRAIVRVGKACSRGEIISVLLELAGDDALTTATHRRLVLMFDTVKEFRLRDGL